MAQQRENYDIILSDGFLLFL